MNQKLDVPYYSQFLDIQDPFWMIRACGAVAFTSVLEYHGKSAPPLLTFCENARERGGYHLENGWVHDYLVDKAKEYGLQAHRMEGLLSLDKIKSSLDAGNPVIVSVEKRVLEQKRFHMIVLTGYISSHESDITSLYYHESESTTKEKGAHRSCDTETFMKYWRGKAIFITQ
jgi:uncharacterized protein YvpB